MATETVETRHPLYLENIIDWTTVRDTLKGQRHIKEKGLTYLPATSGMREAGLSVSGGLIDEGLAMYKAYVMRAVFPSLVRPAVNALVGVMHREPADIKLPKAMESIRENATLEGESLQTLLMRINESQLEAGRIGLLADVPTGLEDPMPFITTYEAEHIINWDCSRRPDGREKPDLVVLDESDWERTSTFGWDFVKKHLVLDLKNADDLGEAQTAGTPSTPETGAVYRSRLEISDDSVVTNEEVNRQTEVTAQSAVDIVGLTPSIRGRTLEQIPFVFVGSIDLTAAPDQIPMLDLADLSLTIYRGEADYRHTLFMQGQDTLVVIGDAPGSGTADGAGQKKKRTVGASASLDLQIGGDAKYIGVSSAGLPEQRSAIENDRDHGSELGANLLSSSSGSGKEAEESLRIRVAARTASITTVVKAGAEGLQTILRKIAQWKGLNPEEVVVTPNMDFVGDSFEPKQLVDLMTAKNMGAPLARESVHRWLRDKDVTNFSLEEEIQKIEEEEPIKGEPDPEAEASAKAEAQAFMLAQMTGNEDGKTGDKKPAEGEGDPGDDDVGDKDE